MYLHQPENPSASPPPSIFGWRAAHTLGHGAHYHQPPRPAAVAAAAVATAAPAGGCRRAHLRGNEPLASLEDGRTPLELLAAPAKPWAWAWA